MTQGYMRSDLALEQINRLREDNAALATLVLRLLARIDAADRIAADANPMPRFHLFSVNLRRMRHRGEG